jgi:hypothetical protein
MARQRRTARVRIGKELWTIRRCKVPRDRWGDCDKEKRLIRVDERIGGTDLLGVIIHEMIHARWWCLSECEVTEFGDEVAGVLEAFGFHDGEDADG